jgi:hypothetical protein
VAPQNSQRQRKFAAEFSADLPKKWQKRGRTFFEVGFSHKILDTLKKKTVKSTELPDFFPITMPSESLLTSIKPASMKRVCAAEFFRQRPNFSVNLAENFWPELATLKPMSES